jgi:hypothetical protein
MWHITSNWVLSRILGCLELCTPAYSLHPKLHFHTNFIFVSFLVPEILANFFCPSGKFFPEKMKDLCQDFHYFTIAWCNKICPKVIGCPFTSWWIVGKRSSFSYLGQNQKNDRLFCAISQKFVLRLNTHFNVMGHKYGKSLTFVTCYMCYMFLIHTFQVLVRLFFKWQPQLTVSSVLVLRKQSGQQLMLR